MSVLSFRFPPLSDSCLESIGINQPLIEFKAAVYISPLRKSLGPTPFEMLDLTNKVALITGLGQISGTGWGIGAACAFQLAKQGAKVFGGNRSLQSAETTRDLIRQAGGVCDVMTTDATNAESVKALVDACIKQHGRIDILVNNVGRSEPGCPATMSEATWDAQMEINLKSVYLTCHYVLPIMETQKSGSIVSIGSIAGLRYIGKAQIAYNVAKAALLQFTSATAVIYAKRGIRLNAVVPGLMETPYTFQMAARYADGDYDTFKATRDAQVPMGHMGDAWDVANAAVFLVSDEAKYITGQSIVVDGGITSSTGSV
jgi:NAD(P)-dependent dehydrogenase (short-subunit alcohol dehydrogenase family)